MAGRIQFDTEGKSAVFTAGDDTFYFLGTAAFYHDMRAMCTVVYAPTGEPYGRTTDYVWFHDLRAAEDFLAMAEASRGLPHGWR